MRVRAVNDFRKLRVGETGWKVVKLKNGRHRKVTIRRIRSTGFPQFIIVSNMKV